VPNAQTIVDLLPRNTPRAHMSNCTQAVCKWHGGRRYALHFYERWDKIPADQMTRSEFFFHHGVAQRRHTTIMANLLINTFGCL
jgi:hypothetical protein